MEKAKYIDPTIGTVGEADVGHGGGKTHPGACTPGGMVQLSPDTITGGDNGTGYNYCNDTIEGFSFNHMSGIGWYGDLGNLQIMPVTGKTDLRSGSNEEVPFTKGKEGWKSPFSHDKEVARAGYYSVFLDRYGITAETTVSPHTGMLRFSYPENSDAKVIFNFSRRIGGHADFQKIKITGEKSIEGEIICTPKGGGFGRGGGNISYNFYFSLEMSEKAEEMQFFSNEKFVDNNITSFENEDAGLLCSFGSLEKPLEIRCGISYVDIEGARKNLEAECPTFDFDKMEKNAFDSWDKAFSKIQVEGTDETDLKIFYTCLYHVLLDPRTMADVDGRFPLDGKILHTESYTHRTMFSGWDVYRSEFPLLTVIEPEIVNDEVNSLLKIAETKNTSLPAWELMGIDAGCMVGDPALIVTADAFVKGIRNYDFKKAYEIAKASALCKKELFGKPFKSLRPDCKQYLEKAFVPKKISETLEFLLADYTLSQFAKEINNNEDSEYFLSRAMRYPENYNKRLGFLISRRKNGWFCFERDIYDGIGTVESNIFQQTWFVPYDVVGLSRLFGEKRTIKLLERFFEEADLSKLWNESYNHSNEPCHNITHYFNILGLPDKTQYWTRRVQKEAYRTGAFGFCGNEDVGQLSAWYVLSALGFAQVCPADPKYYMNTPLFRTCKIALDKKYHSCSVSETFEIVCDKNPLEYPYISSLSFNGKEITRPYLTYNEITSGGVLNFTLSKTPCNAFENYVPESFPDM
ncbi:MAG: GH92 family glycosyl hydrolase [Clostridia bacterium]|nr:GH92 family glycosyl hydrolase [Clostridia bacterium]